MQLNQDFTDLPEFLEAFPLDELTLPVCIQAPETKEDYWLIQIALPMKNIVVNCNIWRATKRDIDKYRFKAHALMKKTLEMEEKV